MALCSGKVVKALASASSSTAVSEQNGGDQYNLGGVLVAAASRCYYVERQLGYADLPCFEDLLAATNLAAQELEQMRLADPGEHEADTDR
jgi:hypothetical protein|eukprot:COSAG01_NODE_6772_length_3505_cov_20.000294_2_plen_90_part_00